MSILHADFPSGSQGLYGTSIAKMADGVWAVSPGGIVADPDPNIGAAGAVMFFGQSNSARFILPAAVSTVGISLRYYRGSFTQAALHVIAEALAVDGTVQCSVGVDINGYIRVYRGTAISGGVLIYSSAGPVFTANAWRHAETKIFLSKTVGTVELRVEGVVIFAATGLNNVSHATDSLAYSVGVRHNNNAAQDFMYIKDIVFWDGLGAQNNNFLSTVGVYWRPVNSDVSSGWTRSSGTSDYQLLNESPPVDTGYISAPAALPAPSKMGFAALPADVVAIRGLMAVQRGMKTDSGDGNIQQSLSPNAATYAVGADTPMSTSFTYYRDIKELSPVSGVAWTPAEFATLQLRINRTI